MKKKKIMKKKKVIINKLYKLKDKIFIIFLFKKRMNYILYNKFLIKKNNKI